LKRAEETVIGLNWIQLDSIGFNWIGTGGDGQRLMNAGSARAAGVGGGRRWKPVTSPPSINARRRLLLRRAAARQRPFNSGPLPSASRALTLDRRVASLFDAGAVSGFPTGRFFRRLMAFVRDPCSIAGRFLNFFLIGLDLGFFLLGFFFFIFYRIGMIII